MQYKVVSVPHTGTRFTMRFLQLLEISPTRNHVNPQDYALDIALDIPKDLRMVIPRRDPGSTYISRKQRRAHYENQPHYRRTNNGTPLTNMLGQIERLERLLKEYGDQCFILPVDTPLHRHFWRNLTQFLEIPHGRMANASVLDFIHKWEKIGHFEYKYPNAEVPPEIEAIRERWGYSGACK